MKEETLYSCEKCSYKTESLEKAVAHEKQHLIDEGKICECQSDMYKGISILSAVIGYGRSIYTDLILKGSPTIVTRYAYACDSYDTSSLPIKFCPLCGRKLVE